MNRNPLAVVLLSFLGLALTFIISSYSDVAAQKPPRNSSVPRPATVTRAKAKLAEAKPSLKSSPNPDKPTEVAVGFYLINLGRINQSDETFDVSGYLSANWQDERLAFDPKVVGDTEKHENPEQVWEPALTIVNAQSSPKKTAVSITAQPDGNVDYLELVNTTVSSDLNLRNFPFDSQKAQVVLESLFFDDKTMVFHNDPKLTGYSKDSFVSLSEWQILDVNTTVAPEKFAPNGKKYSRYTFELKLKRNYQFYLFKVFIPLLLITLLSWATFWMDSNAAFSTQMSVGMTSTLTAITFNFTVANALPRLSYLTLLDAYIFICYIFFFLSIVANVSVHFLLKNYENPDFIHRMTRRFRWIFPLAFVIFQGIVMTVFLVGAN